MRISMLLAMTALVVIACNRPMRTPHEGTPGSARLKVMSYNVNFGLAGDKDGIAAIRAGDADLVVLQETTDAWERALRRTLASVYPHIAFRHCCGAGGLAILSRFPFEDKDYLAPTDDGWFPAWRVIVDSPLGSVQVLAVHLHPPLSDSGSIVSGYITTPRVRLGEIETFSDHLDDSLPTLVVGDFNEPSDGRALRFLADRGLHSALPEFHPGADTWSWPTSVGTVHSQLDHIVYNGRLEPLDAQVLAGGRSDHQPVVAVFERAEKPISTRTGR